MEVPSSLDIIKENKKNLNKKQRNKEDKTNH
jgi:hypothetical protein